MSDLDVLNNALRDKVQPDPPHSQTDWAAELSPRRPASRRVQLFLAVLVVGAAGFLGGIVTTQQVEENQTSSGFPEGMTLPEGVELPQGVELPAGAGGVMPDASQLAALSGGATSYTVTVVDGSTLYLQDPSGTTVKVVTLPTTNVRHLSEGATTDLRPGDTVTVTGEADEAGTILAEAVDQTQ